MVLQAKVVPVLLVERYVVPETIIVPYISKLPEPLYAPGPSNPSIAAFPKDVEPLPVRFNVDPADITTSNLVGVVVAVAA